MSSPRSPLRKLSTVSTPMATRAPSRVTALKAVMSYPPLAQPGRSAQIGRVAPPRARASGTILTPREQASGVAEAAASARRDVGSQRREEAVDEPAECAVAH